MRFRWGIGKLRDEFGSKNLFCPNFVLAFSEADSETLNGHNSTQSSRQKLILDRFYIVSCALSDGSLRGT